MCKGKIICLAILSTESLGNLYPETHNSSDTFPNKGLPSYASSLCPPAWHLLGPLWGNLPPIPFSLLACSGLSVSISSDCPVLLFPGLINPLVLYNFIFIGQDIPTQKMEAVIPLKCCLIPPVLHSIRSAEDQLLHTPYWPWCSFILDTDVLLQS